MMRKKILIYPVSILIIALFLASCASKKDVMIEVYETSADGHKLTPLEIFSKGEIVSEITINPQEKRQVITGFGGAFTESSASVLNQLSPEKKDQIINAVPRVSARHASLCGYQVSPQLLRSR